MNIFILEDNKTRIDLFKEKFKNNFLVIKTLAKEAIDYLKNDSSFDWILLDHDLGGEQWVDSYKENTGYQVAKFIMEEGINEKCKIGVHSLNFVGAKNILSLIPDSEYLPGIWLEKEFVGFFEKN
jgi:CheY-like chemotaxis protein